MYLETSRANVAAFDGQLQGIVIPRSTMSHVASATGTPGEPYSHAVLSCFSLVNDSDPRRLSDAATCAEAIECPDEECKAACEQTHGDYNLLRAVFSKYRAAVLATRACNVKLASFSTQTENDRLLPPGAVTAPSTFHFEKGAGVLRRLKEAKIPCAAANAGESVNAVCVNVTVTPSLVPDYGATPVRLLERAHESYRALVNEALGFADKQRARLVWMAAVGTLTNAYLTATAMHSNYAAACESCVDSAAAGSVSGCSALRDPRGVAFSASDYEDATGTVRVLGSVIPNEAMRLRDFYPPVDINGSVCWFQEDLVVDDENRVYTRPECRKSIGLCAKPTLNSAYVRCLSRASDCLYVCGECYGPVCYRAESEEYAVHVPEGSYLIKGKPPKKITLHSRDPCVQAVEAVSLAYDDVGLVNASCKTALSATESVKNKLSAVVDMATATRISISKAHEDITRLENESRCSRDDAVSLAGLTFSVTALFISVILTIVSATRHRPKTNTAQTHPNVKYEKMLIGN